MSDVDVIVLDIDGGAMLEQCIASIRAQTRRPASIVVFDNGSRTPVSQRLRGSDLTIVRSEVNEGFARGVNEAFRRCRAPFVALVNNDVELEPDWLELVRDAFERDTRVAAVQTIVRRPDGTIDGAGIDVSDGTFRQIGHGQPIGAPLAVAWGVSATAAMYRVEAIGRRIFEETLFAYYEDVELSARLRTAGWRVAVLPVVKATHRGSASAPVLRGDARRLRTRNRYLVARMHRAGSIPALILEDLRLAFRGRTSLRGVVQGLFDPIES